MYNLSFISLKLKLKSLLRQTSSLFENALYLVVYFLSEAKPNPPLINTLNIKDC